MCNSEHEKSNVVLKVLTLKVRFEPTKKVSQFFPRRLILYCVVLEVLVEDMI